MTNTNTIENTHPTDDYMGGYGWFPWVDGFHDCDNGEDLGDGMTMLHGAGLPSDEVLIVTEDGMFCSKGCSEMARRNTLYENALEDRDSWYWDGIEYGEER
jgi:hypothetical protein